MTKTLIIACGVADTRAALLDGETVLRFWLGPARGDEAADDYPILGRRYAGRIARADAALGRAFVDIGTAAQGFLPQPKKGERLVEGALIEVEVKTEPRRKKGPVLRVSNLAPSGAATGPLAGEDAAVMAARALGGDDAAIIVDDPGGKRALEAAGFATVSADNGTGCLWRRHGLDGELAAALNRRVPLQGGGALTIDETEALTAIDVDTGALESASQKRAREKIARAAMKEAMRQIALRNIGGHIVIDFPPQQNAAEQKAFEESVRAAAKEIGGSAASFSKSGLFSFRRPRAAASLLDRLTEEDEPRRSAGGGSRHRRRRSTPSAR
ncbi:MAG: ribonuclease E/G [Parvularculaceae bacterium]